VSVLASGSAELRIDKREGGGVPPAGFTVTVALVWTLRSETPAAVTVTVVLVVTAGAVKRPLLEIVPTLADQVTLVLLKFRRVSENCCVPFEEIVALRGEMERLAGGGPLARCVENPQDAVNPMSQTSKTVRMSECARGSAVVNF
jgi:hypothetical protein